MRGEDGASSVIYPTQGVNKMALPKYDELYNPLLTAMQDGRVHGAKALTSEVAAFLNLSAEDIAELDSNFHRSVFVNRLNWAKTYLKKAGLFDYHFLDN